MRIQKIVWDGNNKQWVAMYVFGKIEDGEGFQKKADAIEYAKYEFPNFIHVEDKKGNQIYTIERNGYKWKRL